eukprot:TRINITY_DN1704_c3_g1_i1.p1 TRINITY_DN1704_c3_g1~~TRINITY_DN1704_c3_g1_i1.p1  ORF type:complete len:465 (+),score=62.74 TRINITY_DN1704_c3_g1_i1:50-1396(+)
MMISTKFTASLLALASTALAYPASYIDNNLELMWKEYKQTYNRTYDDREENARKKIFKENLKIGSELEKRNPRARFGVNLYSDRTQDEFKKLHTMFPDQIRNHQSAKHQEIHISNSTLPDNVDWRKKGAVTHIKNQGQCGSGWAFAAMGSIEGQWEIAGNHLTSLSEQFLVSCDKFDIGCEGGSMSNAYTWLVDKYGGLVLTEQSYPYTSADGISGICQNLTSKVIGSTISSHIDIASSESVIASWVANHGPVSTAVDATSWQSYSGGVLTDCLGIELDHGVLIVGYSSDYWIIKNSWGINWGEAGYIRVLRGSNLCLLAEVPSTAVVSGKLPPSPPTPPPTPSPAQVFTQIQCVDKFCLAECQGYVFPIGQCLPTEKGTALVVSCTSVFGLSLNEFHTLDCTGVYNITYFPVGQCSLDKDGSFTENICGQVPNSLQVSTQALKLGRY